jgi:hypothetical protein
MLGEEFDDILPHAIPPEQLEELLSLQPRRLVPLPVLLLQPSHFIAHFLLHHLRLLRLLLLFFLVAFLFPAAPLLLVAFLFPAAILLLQSFLLTKALLLPESIGHSLILYYSRSLFYPTRFNCPMPMSFIQNPVEDLLLRVFTKMSILEGIIV